MLKPLLNQSWFLKQDGQEVSEQLTCSLYSSNSRVLRFVFSDLMSDVVCRLGNREFQAIGKVTEGNLERKSLQMGPG